MNPLARAHRISLYAAGVVLLLTGVVWALLHYLALQLGIDDRVAVPGAALLMKIHGAAAMLALLLLGALLPEHVYAGWRLARNRASGIAVGVLAGLLILTGYLLYYAGGDLLRQGASILHLGVGAVLPALLLAHTLR